MHKMVDVARCFTSDGPLAAVLPGYQHRSEQAELASAIARSLAVGEVGFFEAGTGTGKSFAYLIPAALFALERKKPVVISTYTIALQEQLVFKDIPVLQEIFPELKCVLVKGWSNYICRLRLSAALRSPGDLLDPGSGDALLQLAAWADSTEDGTRSDLGFAVAEGVWDEVCAESDSCLRAACPHFGACELFRDRAKMQGAHLLVVNHHLLFADMSVRREAGWETDQGVLPPYDAVVMDEAHHLEDVAGGHFGASVSTLGVAQLFGRIHRTRQGRSVGLIAALHEAFAAQAGDEADSALAHLREEAIPAAMEAERSVQDFLEAAAHYLRQAGIQTGEVDTALIEPGGEWPQVAGERGHLAALCIDRLAAALTKARKALQDGEEAPDPALISRLDAAKRRLQNLSRPLSHLGDPDFDNRVYWVERAARRRQSVRVLFAPIDVGPFFVEWIERQCEALVMTSATLAVGESFAYTRRRLGLYGTREVGGKLGVRELLVRSPFDYAEQALLGIVDDLPEPNRGSAYRDALPGALEELVRASDGRALILFTSYAALTAVAEAMEERLEDGITLLVQGRAGRSQILRRFQEGGRAVLLGTDSFWEGIDVPGEALSLVIVTRLPFDVPTDPLAASRAEKIREEGGSPFADYTLPRAALKLKQGFGRLIRTENDRGAVVICDSRIATKAYGRYFLDALPRCRRVQGRTRDVAYQVKQFLSS